MRYLKKYEYFDRWDDENKKLTESLIITLRKFIHSLYPEVESTIIKKKWAHSIENFIILDNIKPMNIERFNNRNIEKYAWISVDKNLFNITIKFKDLLDYEVDKLTICQFLVNIFKKYQTNKHGYIFVIEHKNIQKVINEITLENYELFSDTEKYNL
jgi:hypothetical protein